jgi:hypothetical protein
MTPGRSLPARWISAEIHERARPQPRCGRVVASFDSALYADFDGWTAALTPATTPRMPNGLTVSATFGGPAWPRVGDRALLSDGALGFPLLAVTWDARRPPRWNAEVPLWDAGRRRLRDRANALLASCTGERGPFEPGRALRRIRGFDPSDADAATGLGFLLAAVRRRDPGAGAQAARRLVGRGPGLTPVGDDVLAAAALTVASAGATCGFQPAEVGSWLAALAPPDLRSRTTSVSATMLELALRGRGVEPAHSLLDPRPAPAVGLATAVRRIGRLGHTTGPAYAATIGACALALAETGQASNHRTREHVT